jgi:3-oxoacyl-[acyl-carrier protein] reductase
MEISLKNKVILITGATGKFGKALTFACRREKAKVLAVYFSDETTADELKKAGAETFFCDVKEYGLVGKIVGSQIEKFGRIDGLVNAAAVSRDKLLFKMTPKEFREVIDINLMGIFNFTKAVLKSMMKEKCGKIINFASIIGMKGAYGASNYSASKAGVIAFTKSVASEVARYGICVNAVTPGFFPSKINQQIPEKIREKAREESVFKKYADPHEIADFIIYLLSDKVRNITGQVFCLESRIV